MHESRAERIGLESEEKSRKQQAEFDMLKGQNLKIFLKILNIVQFIFENPG